MKNYFLVIIASIVAVMAMAAFTLAIPDPSGAVGTAEWVGNFTQSTASSTTAHGGQVSQFYLAANSTTHRWQGYLGNVTGVLALGNGSDILLNFGAPEFDTVFATTNSGAVPWTTLQAGAAADVDTQWGFSTGKDTAVTAFNTTATLAGISVPVATATGDFLTGVFNDGSSAAKDNHVFGAEVYSTAKAGLGGNEYQYELVVPTPTDGDETYYFYVRLAE